MDNAWPWNALKLVLKIGDTTFGKYSLKFSSDTIKQYYQFVGSQDFVLVVKTSSKSLFGVWRLSERFHIGDIMFLQ